MGIETKITYVCDHCGKSHGSRNGLIKLDRATRYVNKTWVVESHLTNQLYCDVNCMIAGLNDWDKKIGD